MKAKGVDYNSKNKLISLAKEGYTAEEISSMIQVDEDCVKGWMKYLKLDNEVVAATDTEVETEIEEEEEE